MDKRNFRERLREHKIEPSVPAWTQMEGMLDALPQEEKKEKKRFFFWLFLLAGLVVVTGALTLNLNTSTSEIKDTTLQLSHSTKKSELIEKYEVDNEKDLVQTKAAHKQSVKVPQVESNENKVINQVELEESQSVADNQRTNDIATLKLKNDFEDNKASTIDSKDNNNNNNNNSIERDQVFDDNVQIRNHNGIKTSIEISPIDKANIIYEQESSKVGIDNIMSFSNEEDLNGTELNAETPTKKEAQVSQTVDREEVKSRDLVDSLSTLLTSFSPFSYDPYDMGDTKVIKNIGPSRLFWLVAAGYAEFNNNPGMIFSAGFIYDVDRIVDLELNTMYSFGKGPVLDGTELRTKEDQVDLNLMVHLNFVKNKKHKFSFDLGAGLTYYIGNRVITGPEPYVFAVKGFGRNLQMGFSYHYSLNKDTKLGLRLGVISYNDAIVYISSRFVKRF